MCSTFIAVAAATNVANAPAAWFDGTNTIALWVTRGVANPLVGARINASGSKVQGDATSAYEFLLQNTRDALDFSADFRADFGMAAWKEDAGIKAVRLQSNSGGVPAVTPESVSFSGTAHTGAAIASNGADFLVAYSAYLETKMFVRAISGLTGAPLGPQQLLTVGSDTQLGLAWSGKFHIATMHSVSSIYMRYVGCDGTPFSGAPVLLGPILARWSAGHRVVVPSQTRRAALLAKLSTIASFRSTTTRASRSETKRVALRAPPSRSGACSK